MITNRSSILLLALLSALCTAQDPATPRPEPDPPQEQPLTSTEISWDRVQKVHYEHGTGRLFLLGDVDVRLGERRIRCQNLVAWVDTSRTEPRTEPPPVPEGEGLLPPSAREAAAAASEWVTELYAEGHVLFLEHGRWLEAERLYLDLRRERGLLIDATVAVDLDTRNGVTPLVAKAQELRLLSADRMIGSGVQTYITPHGQSSTYVTQEQLELVKDPPITGEDGQPIVNYHVRSSGNVLHLGGSPVLWLPDFVGDTAEGRNSLFLENVRLRRSNQMGIEAGVTFGDEILNSDGVPWGKWAADLDWFSKRGPGVGGRLDYGTEDYYGTFIGRYQRDTGKDKNYGEPPTNNRGRISWWHRHKFDSSLQLDLELNLFSDRGYYPTYFEDEFKGIKPPENIAFLKKTFFNSQISALASGRFNHWLTRTEHLPELRYDLVTEPLFDIADRPLYLTTTVRASNSRIEYDADLSLRNRSTMRFDADTLVEYAFPLGPLKIRPFAGIRASWFQRDLLSHDDEHRLGFTHGVTIATQAWKVFDSDGGLFNLSGLRHVIIPELTFRNTVGVRVSPNELIPFDDIEAYDNEQTFGLRVRNLFQTIRDRDEGPMVDTFVDLEIEQLFYPNADRDHGSEPWGNLDVDLLVRFSDNFQFLTDFELNYYGRGFEVANAAFGYTPGDDLQVYSGYRHFDGSYDAVFVQANYRLDEKWMFTAEGAYDFQEDRGLDHRFILSHIGPEWVFQVGVNADLGENDFGILFSFEPRWLFNPVLRPSALRAEPRLYYLGDRLSGR